MTNFKVESYIWLSAVVCVVVARFVVRIWHFKSLKRLQIEDYLMLFLTCLYIILIVFLNIDLTVSTNLIDPAHPVNLTPEEIKIRTWGSKTVLLVEQCMCAIQWGTKACLLFLYWRLTENLTEAYVVRTAAAYVAITYVVMLILYFAVWCRPFHEYWATPSNNPQCTTALHHLITNLVFNLTSDLLILSIPLPMFLGAKLGLKKKLLLIFPFALGFFTIICAILSKHTSFTKPYSSQWVYWYCREASTAMIVANMPYSWSLIRRVLKLQSFFGTFSGPEVSESHRGSGGGGGGGGGGGSSGQAHSHGLHSHSLGDMGSKEIGEDSLTMASQNQDTGGTCKCKPKLGLLSSWHSKSTSMSEHQSTGTSTSNSSHSTENTPSRQPIQNTTSSTSDAVDKLYRLDEDALEFQTLNTMSRRYDG